MDKRPPPCSKRELYKIRTKKKFARRFLCLMIKILLHFNAAFYESLGREMVLSRLKHLDVLLVLLQIMKVLVEIDKTQTGKDKLVNTKEFTFDEDNY